MTSLINGLVSTGPPDPGISARLPEQKREEKVENSRFHEQLDKAMSQENEAQPREVKSAETPVKEEMVNKGKKKVSPVKEQVAERAGKTQKKPVGDESGVGMETLALQFPMQSEKTESDEKTNNLSLKASKKAIISVSNGNREQTEEEKSLLQSKSGTLQNDGQLNNLKGNVKEKAGSEEDIDDNVDEPVIIPFPGAGEAQRTESVTEQPQLVTEGADKAVKGIQNGQKKEKEEPVLTVVDTRSKNTQEVSPDRVVAKTAQTAESVDAAAKDNNPIVLGEQNVERIGGEDNKSFESRMTENREVVLARELRESGNDQIVKKASFVLKDSNQGEIKLILKPEALGRVKIHLNMNENNLVGKIIVENNRVGQIFENNLNNLSKAFEEAGISSSSLEVSVGDGRENGAGREQFEQREQPFYSERLKTLDQAVPTVNTIAERQNHRLINLVV